MFLNACVHRLDLGFTSHPKDSATLLSNTQKIPTLPEPGIEPRSTTWKADVLTTTLYPHSKIPFLVNGQGWCNTITSLKFRNRRCNFDKSECLVRYIYIYIWLHWLMMYLCTYVSSLFLICAFVYDSIFTLFVFMLMCLCNPITLHICVIHVNMNVCLCTLIYPFMFVRVFECL